MSIATHYLERMKACGFNVTDIADELSISRQSVHGWLNGTEPSQEHLDCLIAAARRAEKDADGIRSIDDIPESFWDTVRSEFEEDFEASQMPSESNWFSTSDDGRYTKPFVNQAWFGFKLARRRSLEIARLGSKKGPSEAGKGATVQPTEAQGERLPDWWSSVEDEDGAETPDAFAEYYDEGYTFELIPWKQLGAPQEFTCKRDEQGVMRALKPPEVSGPQSN